MDKRDKQLQQHMRRRQLLAARLPLARQRYWAEKCLALATRQHRIAFYMLAQLWLASTQTALSAQ